MNNISRMNNKNILFSSIFFLVIFPLLMCISTVHAVIQISSIEELQKIGNDPAYPLDGEYELTQDIDASDTISWNDFAGFKPIGTPGWIKNAGPFVGKFDGKGHKIRKLYINRPGIGFDIGLFGYIGSTGEVYNLGIEDAWIVGGEYKGIIAGSNYGKVSNCYTKGNIIWGNNCGGIIGGNYGTVSNCYSMNYISGKSCVGEIIGKNKGTVLNCYSTCRPLGKSNTGGLIGCNENGNIMSCYWDIETSGYNISAGGEGKTTAEMRQKATYIDWDFTSVWAIEEGVSYPWLKIFGQPQSSSPLNIPEKEIWTLEELNKIGRDWNYPWYGNYKLMADIDASDTINWNEGEGFKPIKIFMGIFDGNGHKIRKLYINRPEEEFVGLFGVILPEGKVENLGIEDCWIVGGDGTAIIAGFNNGTISNCYSIGKVFGKYSVGGLTNNNGIVVNCYSMGKVWGQEGVGGLSEDNDGTIINSYTTCNLFGRDTTMNHGTVTNCYWNKETIGFDECFQGEGKTTEQMKHQSTYNGWDFTSVWAIDEGVSYPWLKIFGKNQIFEQNQILVEPVVEKEIRTLEELNKIGRDWEYPWDGHYTLMADIDATDTKNWNGGKGFKPLGGFTGVFNGNGHKIRKLYINRPNDEGNVGLFGLIGLKGMVYDLGLEECQIIGGKLTGILVGVNFGTIGRSYTSNRVSGKGDVGGFVGFNRGSIIQCYSFGSVSGNYYYGAVGGFVGENQCGDISDCYSLCIVSGYCLGIGGFVGDNNFGNVGNCYSISYVSGGERFGDFACLNEEGTVVHSYWNIETLRQGWTDGDIEKTTGEKKTSEYVDNQMFIGIEGKTSKDMKQRATYVGWDFSNVWRIQEGVTYPYFLWQEGKGVVVPNIIGMEQNLAISVITDAGLVVGTINKQCSDTIPVNKVISQNPAEGAYINKGSPIDIIVSTGPCKEKVTENKKDK